jgi:hypothetical protein
LIGRSLCASLCAQCGVANLSGAIFGRWDWKNGKTQHEKIRRPQVTKSPLTSVKSTTVKAHQKSFDELGITNLPKKRSFEVNDTDFEHWLPITTKPGAGLMNGSTMFIDNSAEEMIYLSWTFLSI